MARGFNVQEFRSVIDGNRGLLQNNKFLVQIPTPPKLIGTLTSERMLCFYCKAAPLPGIGIASSDVYRYGYGPIERRPYGTLMNDAMLQFYVDGNNIVRKWFRNWVRLITNPDTNKGINSKFAPNNQSAYEFSYKKDYAVDIKISVFSPEGREIIGSTMIEAWPNYVGDVMQDWQDKNSLMVMPVSFTFRDWYEDSVPTTRKSATIVSVDSERLSGIDGFRTATPEELSQFGG